MTKKETKSRFVDDNVEGLRIWRDGKKVLGPSGPLKAELPEPVEPGK